MKILIVGINSWYIFHFWLPLLKNLKKDNEVFILSEYDEFAEKLKNEGLNYININFSNTSINIIRNFKSLINLYSVYKNIKPDIVHHFNPKPVLMGSLIAHILGIKKIFNNYPGLGNLFRKDKLKFNIIRPFISLAYKIINRKNVISIFQVNRDERLFIDKKLIGKSKSLTIASSGVNLNKYKFRNKFNTSNKLKVAMISRINFDKGIDIYFKIASSLKYKCDFYLAGQFYEHENPNLSLQDLKISCSKNSISYLSFVENIDELLKKIDIVILPTRRLEGVPKIILEACSSGAIPIVSDIGGCKEIVKENNNGYLIKVGDVEKFTKMIERIDDDRTKLTELGKNGRILIEQHFEVGEITNKYLKIYEEHRKQLKL